MAKTVSPVRRKKLLGFLRELEKLKTVKRIIYLPDGSQENSAEHSWAVTMYALLLTAEAEPEADLLKVLKIALIHDIVEIYAGDTYLFDEKARENKKEREYRAAKQLFAKLPKDVGTEFWLLFEEFEELSTVEARLVKSFDHLQPLVHNLQFDGMTWLRRSITAKMHDDKKRAHMLHNPVIQEIYEGLHQEALKRDLFAKD